MLATFMALSQVDPELRKALSKVELPKKLKVGSGQTLDQNLSNLADNMINRLSNAVIGGDAKGTLRLKSQSQGWIDLAVIS